jgi:hypothetical protein
MTPGPGPLPHRRGAQVRPAKAPQRGAEAAGFAARGRLASASALPRAPGPVGAGRRGGGAQWPASEPGTEGGASSGPVPQCEGFGPVVKVSDPPRRMSSVLIQVWFSCFPPSEADWM